MGFLNTRLRPPLAAVVLAAIVAMALSACGSSDDDGGSTSAASTGESSGAATSGGNSDFVEEAKRLTAEAEEPPTSIGYTEQLKEAPQPGKTVVYVTCNTSPECVQIGDGFEEAADAVGWKVKKLNWQAEQPATLPAALQTALRYDPVATYFFAPSSYSQYASVVPEYTKAGAKLMQAALFADAPDIPTIIHPGPSSEYAAELGGEKIGNAFVSASEGEGSALLVTISGIGLVDAVQGSIEDVLEPCESCDLNVLSGTVEDWLGNKLPPQIISKLRQNPDIKYVITLYSGFVTGLRQQLDAAGLGDVKILGYFWNGESITGIKAGNDIAWTSFPPKYLGWQGLDQILRADQGMEIPKEAGVPADQLITPSNVDTIEDTAAYEPQFDYRAEFEGLWKVK
jgi:ABC-type sugar transport system substrate-binding protein